MEESVERLSRNRTLLMGMSMISIMLFHQHFFPLRFFSLFGHWGVDVFFFLSGMGVSYSLRKNNLARYYVNRVKRIMPAWICVSVLCALASVAMGTSILASIINSKIMTLWFLRSLLIFYAVSPFILQTISKKGKKALYAFLAPGPLVLLLSYTPWLYSLKISHPMLFTTIAWSAMRFPIYLLGLAYTLYPVERWCGRGKLAPCQFILFLVPMLVAAVMRWCSMSLPLQGVGATALDGWQYIVLAPAIPVMMLLVTKLIDACYTKQTARVFALVSIFGTLSLELYLWHEWIFAQVGRCAVFTANVPSVLAFALCVLLSLALAWLTHKGCSLVWAKRQRDFVMNK